MRLLNKCKILSGDTQPPVLGDEAEQIIADFEVAHKAGSLHRGKLCRVIPYARFYSAHFLSGDYYLSNGFRRVSGTAIVVCI